MSWQARGEFARAAEGYRELLAAHRSHPDDWYNLGWVLRQLGDFRAALDAYDEALQRGVSQPEEVHLNRAAILSTELNRDEAARNALEQALQCNARYAPAKLNLGNLHEEAGRRKEALACYEQLQDELPASDSIRLEALARMAHLNPPESADDPRLIAMEAAAKRAGNNAEISANLNLALARAYDRLGCYKQAFGAMRSGNKAAARQAPAYQPTRQERVTDALIQTFPAAMEPAAATGAREVRPVFVCGMYRSGSTLVEQLLGAHSRVHCGGELDLLPRLVLEQLQPFPQAAAELDAADVQGLAAAYRKGLDQALPGLRVGQVVTDKRPPNFLFIGLIRRLFPDARIIHTVRNPLDTALSIFMHHLETKAAPYACDLTSIGHYYLQYRRLMAHWHSAFPGFIHDVGYDELVVEPKPVVSSMLAFLGLDWESACLDFHRRASTVRTASYWQVRQPLYSSSSGRWHHYRDELEGLRSQLLAGGIAESEMPLGP